MNLKYIMVKSFNKIKCILLSQRNYTQRYMLYGSTYGTLLKRQTISGFQEVGLRGWADYKRTRKPFGAGKILYLDCCSFTTLCALVKTQQKKRTNFAM